MSILWYSSMKVRTARSCIFEIGMIYFNLLTLLNLLTIGDFIMIQLNQNSIAKNSNLSFSVFQMKTAFQSSFQNVMSKSSDTIKFLPVW